MGLFALAITLVLSKVFQQATCGPCCPAALGPDTCRVGCPPPYPTALFRPAPDHRHLVQPSPSGIVIVEIGIDGEGRAVSACVLRGLREDADRAAQEAALRSRWTSKVLDGRPIGVAMTVTFEFPRRMRWVAPMTTARTALPVARGPISYVDPRTPCPSDPKGPVRLGPNIDPPLLTYVEPDTPEGHAAGVAIMEVLIGADGQVTRTRALRGDSELTIPVAAAVERWHFARTCGGGIALPVIKTVALALRDTRTEGTRLPR